MRFSSTLGRFIVACCAGALLLSGCVLDPDGDTRNDDPNAEVAVALGTHLDSYAIETTGKPAIDAHFFGISGASSLSDAMEKDILTTLQDGGAFHKRRAFDPTLTAPDARWKAAEFVEDRGQGPEPSPAGDVGATDQPSAGTETAEAGPAISVFNSVVAAGGDFVISRLTTSIDGDEKQRAYVTDLEKNTTKPASEMFAAGVDDAGDMVIDDKGQPVIDGETADTDDLSHLGKTVSAAVGDDLTDVSDSESYLPDYSCELIPCTALTYDDGPADEQMTKELTDNLKTANLRATFYQIGRNVHEHPKVSKELLDQGNEVGNHSWSHPKLGTLKAPKIKREIKDTDDTLEKVGVPTTTQLRPPYGSSSRTVDKTVDKRIIQWNIDTQDWKTRSTEKTIEAGSKAGPGSIILMHSIHDTTIKAAPQLYENLKAKGLYPVPAGYLFKGLPFEGNGEYFCRGYGSPLCSNPEHPMVEKGNAMAKPAPKR